LASISSGFSHPEGNGSNGIFVVAEALGQHEAEAGLPLRPYAQAGGVFQRALEATGIARSGFTIYNTIQCRPPRDFLTGSPYEIPAISHCWQNHLGPAMQAAKPKLILALGGTATREQTGWSGPKKGVSYIRGFAIDSPHFKDADGRPVPVISTYHPSFLARGKTNLTGVFHDDIRTAFRFASLGRRGWSRPTFARFAINPPLDFCLRWLANLQAHPELDITYDIETKESLLAEDESALKALDGGRIQVSHVPLDGNPDAGTSEEDLFEEISDEGEFGSPQVVETYITQVQFSTAPDEAIVVKWDPTYIPFIKAVFALGHKKYGFNNRAFDDPLLRHAGVVFGGPPTHDLMWMWHHLQPDLPRGLQFVSSFFAPECEPWKHLAQEDEGFYGGCDVAHPQRIKTGLEAKLKELGLWWGYERHVYALSLILERASARGWPVNYEAQQKLDKAITIEQHHIFQQLQGMFPESLKKCDPPSGYASERVALKSYQKAAAGIQAGLPAWEWKQYINWEKRRFSTLQRKKKLTAKDGAPHGEIILDADDPRIATKAQQAKIKALLKKQQAAGIAGAGFGDYDLPAAHLLFGMSAEQKISQPSQSRDALFATQAREIVLPPGFNFASSPGAGSGNSRSMAPVLPPGLQPWKPATLAPIPTDVWLRVVDKVRVPGEGELVGFIRKSDEERWTRIMPFLPNSTQHLQAYIRFKGYKMPLTQKEGKPTTAKEELLKLGVKHEDPFFGKVIEFRQMHKVRSTYIWPLVSRGGFDPIPWKEVPEEWRKEAGADSEEAWDAIWKRIGYVHTQFTFAPATGQLSSRNPNIQNIIKNGRLANLFRKVIEAKPGYCLVELDFTAYHALTLGFEALCPEYMWIAQQDVHSFLAGHLLKVPGWQEWRAMCLRQDPDLAKILKKFKEDEREIYPSSQGMVPFAWHRNKKAKPAILGIGFGLGPVKMWRMNEGSFSNSKEAMAVIQIVRDLFPPVFAYQDMIREKAHKQRFLQSMHCYRRWFFDVYKWQALPPKTNFRKSDGVRQGSDGRLYKKQWGNDSESSIAFLPANDAFGHMKEVMIDMECAGLMERYGLVNQIHDSLIFHCRRDRVDSCVADISKRMQRTSLVLRNKVVPDGLGCGVEAMVGRNWKDMKVVYKGTVN
jgi:uracil-DNA glycosylase family 4